MSWVSMNVRKPPLGRAVIFAVTDNFYLNNDEDDSKFAWIGFLNANGTAMDCSGDRGNSIFTPTHWHPIPDLHRIKSE